MNFNKLFTTKASQYVDQAYIDKTLIQLASLPKENREKLKPKIAFFLNCKKESLSRKVFHEIVGRINDLQFFSTEVAKCKHCDDYLDMHNYCLTCDI